MHNFQFSTTQTIVCEAGGIAKCAIFCAELGIRKPIIVTDQGIVSLGFIDELQGTLKAAALDCCVFSETIADPPEQIVLQAVSMAISAQADGVIGIGGGSSMDCAKVVAVLMCENQSIDDIYGVDNINSNRAPLILVPTTAGTGSEVTPVAIVTTGETTKAGIVSSNLIPDIALLDANLTLGLPASITASTGIDAMVHAIEAYTGLLKKNPYSDMLAKEALTLLSRNIEEACANGQNVLARQNMLFGACLAGQAFANSPVAAVHALAYPLGGQFHIPHGLSNALVLPHVIRFNAIQASEHYAQLASIILPNFDKRKSALVQTENLAEYFEKLSKTLNLPTQLRALGIEEKHLPMLAEDAMKQTRLLVNNPRTLGFEDALSIYQNAL